MKLEILKVGNDGEGIVITTIDLFLFIMLIKVK